mmetsp:Transcript_18589/g.42073  ORF Transcript_18589/g.42073 Transcript_18589/m.42073 type:complete len:310 (-) Transcript_18589:1234-2163(-)
MLRGRQHSSAEAVPAPPRLVRVRSCACLPLWLCCGGGRSPKLRKTERGSAPLSTFPRPLPPPPPPAVREAVGPGSRKETAPDSPEQHSAAPAHAMDCTGSNTGGARLPQGRRPVSVPLLSLAVPERVSSSSALASASGPAPDAEAPLCGRAECCVCERTRSSASHSSTRREVRRPSSGAPPVVTHPLCRSRRRCASIGCSSGWCCRPPSAEGRVCHRACSRRSPGSSTSEAPPGPADPPAPTLAKSAALGRGGVRYRVCGCRGSCQLPAEANSTFWGAPAGAVHTASISVPRSQRATTRSCTALTGAGA